MLDKLLEVWDFTHENGFLHSNLDFQNSRPRFSLRTKFQFSTFTFQTFEIFMLRTGSRGFLRSTEWRKVAYPTISRNLDFQNSRSWISPHARFQFSTIIFQTFEISMLRIGSEGSKSLETLIFKILDLELVYMLTFSSLRSFFKLLKFSGYAQGREVFTIDWMVKGRVPNDLSKTLTFLHFLRFKRVHI